MLFTSTRRIGGIVVIVVDAAFFYRQSAWTIDNWRRTLFVCLGVASCLCLCLFVRRAWQANSVQAHFMPVPHKFAPSSACAKQSKESKDLTRARETMWSDVGRVKECAWVFRWLSRTFGVREQGTTPANLYPPAPHQDSNTQTAHTRANATHLRVRVKRAPFPIHMHIAPCVPHTAPPSNISRVCRGRQSRPRVHPDK